MEDGKTPTPAQAKSTGWFKASRHTDAIELIRQNHRAYVLAAIIAHRARWREGYNPHGLEFGEALLGDWENLGMTQQQYRTAKDYLLRWGFATFRSTNRGTIGKLTDTRLFEILPSASNEQNNERGNEQRNDPANDKPRTKSRELKNLGREWGVNASSLSSEASLRATSEEEYEERSWEIAELLDLDSNFVDAFVRQHQSDGWTIPNRRTGRREPIKDLQKALVGFCERLERDRNGE